MRLEQLYHPPVVPALRNTSRGMVKNRQKEVLDKLVEADNFRWFKEKMDKFKDQQV